MTSGHGEKDQLTTPGSIVFIWVPCKRTWVHSTVELIVTPAAAKMLESISLFLTIESWNTAPSCAAAQRS